MYFQRRRWHDLVATYLGQEPVSESGRVPLTAWRLTATSQWVGTTTASSHSSLLLRGLRLHVHDSRPATLRLRLSEILTILRYWIASERWLLISDCLFLYLSWRPSWSKLRGSGWALVWMYDYDYFFPWLFVWFQF